LVRKCIENFQKVNLIVSNILMRWSYMIYQVFFAKKIM